MSKEFKFWEKPSKSFIYDMDKLFKNPSVLPSHIFNGSDKLIIPLQFTCRLDLNQEKIWEGDIVIATYYKHAEKDLSIYQQVKYSNEKQMFVLEPLAPKEEIEFMITYQYCPLYWADKIEKIGNIFETKELFDEKHIKN